MKSFASRALGVVVGIVLLTGPALAGQVYGDVVTAKGQPAPAKLTFTDDAGNTQTVTPDAKGHYEVTLPPGHYRIEADSGTVTPATLDVFHEPRKLKLVVEAK